MHWRSDFQKYNVFRRPDWRYERVLELCDRFPSPGRCTRGDDKVVRVARSFLLRWRNCDDERRRRELYPLNPGLYYAHVLHERSIDAPRPALTIQARLLARQPAEEIGEIVGTLPETVMWYEALFFNVTEYLDQRDWITAQVLVPALMRRYDTPGDDDEDEDYVIAGRRAGAAVAPGRVPAIAHPFFDGSLKLFAYFGGKYLVDAVLSGFQAGKPLTSPDDLPAWLDHAMSTTLRRRSAQAAAQFEINKFNVMQLFEAHARIMEIEKSADGESQRRSDIERHTRAMVDDLPFVVGEAGRRALAGTALGRHDDEASELRDEDILRIGAGEAVPGRAQALKALPPPRKREAAPAESGPDFQ